MGRSRTIDVGDRFLIKGQTVTVVEFISSNKVKIRFEDGYETYSRTERIKTGCVDNPLIRSVVGLGFRGIGCHVASHTNPAYVAWRNMLLRCYDTEVQKRHPSYVGCSVCEEWHNFQNFAEWHVAMFNGYRIDWELDKDLLCKGNKIYSPENCIPLPSVLNCLLITSAASRGKTMIGVNWHTRDLCYQAQCNVHNNSVYLGRFATELEGFLAYKSFKEGYVKQQADKWKDKIDPRAYNALMNYQVEITD